jgi:tRNA (cmo5U34)-methyltransferase
MKKSLDEKSTVSEIRERFDHEVERFSCLETGQQTTIDASLAMELITQAACVCNPNAKVILDLGCGAGNNVLKFLQILSPIDCDLVDLSKPMLRRARQRISAVNTGKIRIFKKDLRSVDLPERHYDIIFATAVLHHLRHDADWEEVFSKIYRLLAPAGSVWITDLVWHENSSIQDIMWVRYGKYLESIGGIEYKNKVFEYIDKEDSPRPVTYQLELLRKVGFTDIDILHKNSCFATFGAKKSGS